MSVEETKRLLRAFRIVPNRLLGQNFLVEPSVFALLSDYASLGKMDVVLDAGAGFGFLTRFLANRCKSIIAVERDPHVAEALREQLRGAGNGTVIEGDVLKATLPEFNKIISIPPYYLSSRLVMWLLERKVECAVLVLQQEFANKLVAVVGSEDYGWLTVVTRYAAAAELLDAVPKEVFYPQPKVDSVIVRLVPWKVAPFAVRDALLFRQMARWLFNRRNKKLDNALVPFIRSALKMSKKEAILRASAVRFGDKRVRELAPKDFGVVADVLSE